MRRLALSLRRETGYFLLPVIPLGLRNIPSRRQDNGSNIRRKLGLHLTFRTFLDQLLVQGRPLFESSSISDLVPCLQSVGISSKSPFMLSLHLFFDRPLLLLPETSSLSDFAQMCFGSRLKLGLHHISLNAFCGGWNDNYVGCSVSDWWA